MVTSQLHYGLLDHGPLNHGPPHALHQDARRRQRLHLRRLLRRSRCPPIPPRSPARISDRHFGVGGDGLILICPADGADAEMRMFNADGSYAEMCGNGIRCVAKYVYDHGIARRNPLRIESAGRIYTLAADARRRQASTRVRVDMGEPILTPAEIPTTFARPRAGGTRRSTCRSTVGGRDAPRHLRLDGQPALRDVRRRS